LRILIVDDCSDKAAAVLQAIKGVVSDEILKAVVVKCSMSEAVQCLATQSFDFIVLDLMVPYIPGGKIDRTAGLELMRQVRGPGALSRNAVVLGLSAFPDEAQSVKAEFEHSAVVLVEYDRDGNWRKTIERAAEDALYISSSRIDLDFLIVVALQEEAEPYHGLPVDLATKSIVDGLNLQFLTLRSNGARGALVRLRQMGLVAASIDTAMAVALFKPKVVAMSGICAGFHERSTLGQLVISSPAWEYQAGKWSSDGFLLAPDQVHLRPRTRVIIDQFLERPGLITALEKAATFAGSRPANLPAAKVAPGATGSAVIAAKERLDHIEKQHRKVAVLDMEAYGVYKAVYEAGHYVEHFFAAKVVVDFADADKSDDVHGYGAAVSAAFCVDAVEELLK
jgi:nucleoside phosphorylase